MVAHRRHASPATGRGIPRMPAKNSISEIRLSLVALGLLRATEAIAWTSIFPYVYALIKSFPDVGDTDVPFYAGLLVAVFTFCEFLSGMLWAKLSDRIGRKFTLLIGAVCGMITSLSLGLSRSLALAVASRAFGGLFNPNVGLVQTCVVELARQDQQRAKALSFVTSLRSMGNLIGPVIGGFLADPVALYPLLFPPDSIWASYPFLLPNLAVALLQAISFIVAFLGLPETNPLLSGQPDTGLRVGKLLFGHCGGQISQERGQYAPLQREQETGVDSRGQADDGAENGDDTFHELEDLSDDDKQQPEAQDMTGTEYERRGAFTLQVILQIVSVSLLAFHKVSSDAIIPTFLAVPAVMSSDSQPNTRRDIFESPGGFGYSNQKVAMVLLSQAIVALVTQATLVPYAINKVGVMKAYRIVLAVYPAMYIFTPLLPKIPPVLSLILLVLDLWIKVILSSIGYICSAILIAKVTPTKALIARVNGASASFSCLSRSVGPAATGKILAVGLERGYAGIAFWTLGVVALLGTLESAFLKEHP